MYRGSTVTLDKCIKYAKWNTYNIHMDHDTLRKNGITIYSEDPLMISVFGENYHHTIKGRKKFVLGGFTKAKKTITRKKYDSNIMHDKEVYMRNVTRKNVGFNIMDVSVRIKIDEVYWLEGEVTVMSSRGSLSWERAYYILDKLFECVKIDVEDSLYNAPYVRAISDKQYCISLRNITDAEFWPIPGSPYCKTHDDNAYRFAISIKDIVGSNFYKYKLIIEDDGTEMYLDTSNLNYYGGSVRVAKPIGFGAYIELTHYVQFKFNRDTEIPKLTKQAAFLFNAFKIRTDSTDPDYFYDPDEDKDEDEFIGMNGVRYRWDREKNDPYRIQYVATMKAQEIMKQDLES